MQRCCLCALLLIVTALTGCGKPAVSGVYTRHTQTKSEMIQIVEGEKGELSGRLEVVLLKPDGAINDNTASLRGLRDDSNISLVLNLNTSSRPSVDASATVTGDRLELSIAGVSNSAEFQKSDLKDFTKHASALREQSTRMLALQAAAADAEQQRQTLSALEARQREAVAAQEANQRASAIALASAVAGIEARIDAFNERFDRVSARAGVVEQNYHELTSRMISMLERERALMSNNNASFARSQLAYSISQSKSKSDELHVSVEQGVQSLQEDEMALRSDIQTVEIACAGISSDANGQDGDTTKMACANLKPKMELFRKKSAYALSTIAQLDTTYQSESKTQSGLVNTSDSLR
jgi:hypothetical protein